MRAWSASRVRDKVTAAAARRNDLNLTSGELTLDFMSALLRELRIHGNDERYILALLLLAKRGELNELYTVR